MNQNVKTSIAAALLVLGALVSRADQTNLVQNLSVRLGGITQGPTHTNRNIVGTSADPVRVGTLDVVQQLGTVTGHSFSDQATLVLVTPLSGGSPAIVIRDGTLAVDVTSFFVYEVKTGFVSTSESNLKSGRSNSTDFSVQRLALVDSANYPALTLHFDVQGIAVDNTTTGPNTTPRIELDANVSGWGDQSGKLLLLEGTFRVQGYSLEVVTGVTPPNV
jgi:hypothetical protein